MIASVWRPWTMAREGRFKGNWRRKTVSDGVNEEWDGAVVSICEDEDGLHGTG